MNDDLDITKTPSKKKIYPETSQIEAEKIPCSFHNCKSSAVSFLKGKSFCREHYEELKKHLKTLRKFGIRLK